VIKLTESFFLGKGGERYCYLHPDDNQKVIKIIHQKGRHNNQNTLEYNYYQFLEQKKINFSNITRCFGWVDTNLGEGLVFDRIHNYDASTIKTFSYYVKHNIFEQEYDLQLIEDLEKYVFENQIVFIDVSLSNIFCQKNSENSYQLIIFDGLGGRRPGFKSWLYRHSQYFRMYKMKKQWKKFLQNYYYEKSLNISLP